MPHHGYSGAEYAFDAFAHFGTAFDFHGLGMAFLHDAYCVGQGFFAVALVAAEGHIAHYEGTSGAFDDALGMVYHLVQRDGKCGHVAGHNVGGRIAHEYDVDTGAVHQ